MRNGKAARRDTANRLLLELSNVYDRRLTLRNVTGIKVQGSKREGQKQEEKWLRSPGYGVLSLRNHVTPQP
jgi:hypothetical protein